MFAQHTGSTRLDAFEGQGLDSERRMLLSLVDNRVKRSGVFDAKTASVRWDDGDDVVIDLLMNDRADVAVSMRIGADHSVEVHIPALHPDFFVRYNAPS